MPRLVRPTHDSAVLASFLQAMEEFADIDDSRKADGFTVEQLREGDRLHCYVDDLLSSRYPNPATAPDTPVPFTLLWWVEGDGQSPVYIGSVCVNHRLNNALRRWGGHIAYNVRPSLRRRGHATAMLTAVLPIARSVGIDRALLTVNAQNLGSRKVIEAGGGRLEKIDGNACYYWISTQPTAPARRSAEIR